MSWGPNQQFFQRICESISYGFLTAMNAIILGCDWDNRMRWSTPFYRGNSDGEGSVVRGGYWIWAWHHSCSSYLSEVFQHLAYVASIVPLCCQVTTTLQTVIQTPQPAEREGEGESAERTVSRWQGNMKWAKHNQTKLRSIILGWIFYHSEQGQKNAVLRCQYHRVVQEVCVKNHSWFWISMCTTCLQDEARLLEAWMVRGFWAHMLSQISVQVFSSLLLRYPKALSSEWGEWGCGKPAKYLSPKHIG